MSNPSTGIRFTLLAAGILGLTGVTLGAMGAHAMRETLSERGMVQAWETGARYHLFHAIAVLGIAAWVRAANADAGVGKLIWAARCWVAGTVLFSGSLYWLAIGGPRWLGPVTPLGGIAFMVGWLLVVLAAFSKRT